MDLIEATARLGEITTKVNALTASNDGIVAQATAIAEALATVQADVAAAMRTFGVLAGQAEALAASLRKAADGLSLTLDKLG